MQYLCGGADGLPRFLLDVEILRLRAYTLQLRATTFLNDSGDFTSVPLSNSKAVRFPV
jgi:hypothetical protein